MEVSVVRQLHARAMKHMVQVECLARRALLEIELRQANPSKLTDSESIDNLCVFV